MNEELGRIRKKRQERKAKAEAIIRSDPELCRTTRIEAAIRYFESLEELTDYGHGDMADFGRWVLDQEQESWTDKDFGLEEEK